MPESKLFFLPYTYTVVGIRSGRRNADVHEFLDEIPVRIPILSSTEVPVGVTVTRRDGAVLTRRAYRGRPVDAFADLKDDPRGNTSPVTPDTLGKSLEMLKDPGVKCMWSEYPLRFAEIDASHDRVKKQVSPMQARDIRDVSFDDREASRVTAIETASFLVFVDGVLHKEVPEFRWQVNLPNRHAPACNLVCRDETDTRSFRGGSPFRLDRLREAETFMQHIMDRSGYPSTTVDTVEDTGAIFWRLDDVGLAMTDLAAWIMNDMANVMAEQMRWMPRDFYGPFCAVRDAMEAGIPDKQSFATDVAALRQSLETGVMPRGKALASSLADIIDPAVWRYRNIDRLLDLDLAPGVDEQAIAASFR